MAYNRKKKTHGKDGIPMADIRPFRALRYNLPKAGDIRELTCPPYDIISPGQRREYLSRNSRNLIRLELPQGDDPYGDAARTLAQWRQEGTLQLDMEPDVYKRQGTGCRRNRRR